MKKILVFAGTRPEAIKMAPVLDALLDRNDIFETRLCSTGQHGEMLRQTFDVFGIHPDFELNVMRDNQTLAQLSGRLFPAIDTILENFRPNAILVQGDTTTVMVAAQCAFYRRIPVGHVEAGLRTGNMLSPFPEEMNRRAVSLVANWHFAPTDKARDNLLAEKISADKIFVTGNTVIDALRMMRKKNMIAPPPLPKEIKNVVLGNKPVVLVTGHRRENFGEGLRNICDALKKLARNFPDANFVYPVHLNPYVRRPVYALLGETPNIILADPLGYATFVRLMDRAAFIMTDSGGIQEEGAAFGKPVLIMRDTTERPEGIAAGISILAGKNEANIYRVASDFLNYPAKAETFRNIKNPYGDGTAGRQIVSHLAYLVE